MEPLCLGKPTDLGRTGAATTLFPEAVLWIARTGSPWRDPPPTFGHWNMVFKRYRDWVKADVVRRIFDAALSDDQDMEFAILGATIVKVHRHAQGKRGTKNQAIGKPRGGWTTKILALTDALGNLVRFILLLSHRFDTVGVAPLINDIEFGGLIADQTFDSDLIIEDLNERTASSHANF